MRKVSLGLVQGTDEKERIHYEMAKILFRMPGQELKTANHILHCLNLVKRKLAVGANGLAREPHWVPVDDPGYHDLDAQSLRRSLSLAGEKLQKSGAQNKAMEYWNSALSLLPENCWDPPASENGVVDGGRDLGDNGSRHAHMMNQVGTRDIPAKRALYHEALKLHLQCIAAERWRENFDQAMKICDIVLANVTDPIDRARVHLHQMEMSMWAYSRPSEATRIVIQCLQELGLSKNISFDPTREEIKEMYGQTHAMLLKHMKDLETDTPKNCKDPKLNMMVEIFKAANATLYFCNIPFLAVGVVQSVKLLCENGYMKGAGSSVVTFAFTHVMWHGCLENTYDLGKLYYRICKDDYHVKFLFHFTIQHWGEHVANSIPAFEEVLQSPDLMSDRLLHTAGLVQLSMLRVFVGRIHLRDCMNHTVDLIAKHIEFGPKTHGVEALQGVLQLIKCLKGQTLSGNTETLFDDNEFAESKVHCKRDKPLVMAHSNSTYTMLKTVGAFVFGHYTYVNEMTNTWHDDPQSMMNFDGSWVNHCTSTVIGLALVNLLRSEKDPEERKMLQRRLFTIRDKMAAQAAKFPINHAAMFYLLEAEIADQALEGGTSDLKTTLLLYEKSIAYGIDGDFPLHRCFSYELAANCHLRHGLVTSARCLIASACKEYQTWGARGKVLWFHKTYPEWLGSPDVETAVPVRGLFYRPSDVETCTAAAYPLGPGASGGPNSSRIGAAVSSGNGSSPWLAGSPKAIYSPRSDVVSVAAVAMAESCNFQANSLHLQNGWLASPQSPEMDNSDLDVLDFSSVIEAMQVIASEIDLGPLLVKSLGVLNQSVGAKRCYVIISKDQELFLAASQRDPVRCESVNPPMLVSKCSWLFQGVINYVKNTSVPCLLTNAKDDPRFCADEYLKKNAELKTVLCAPIMHKAVMVGVLYMDDFPERAFANKRMLVMNLLVQQLGISITNALLYQSVLQSESKLNGLLENMPCGIALWDATAENCQYINSSWEDMTGFTLNEIKQSGWQILTDKDEYELFTQHWRERVQAGMPSQWESRYRLKDGSFRWSVMRMLPIKSTNEDRIIQWLSVTIDIDDQRRAVQLKSNFLANMSHELRTPFSGILGMLSLLRDSSGLSLEQFEFVDMAKASCEMLIRIVDDLLNFSKLEADKVTLEYIPLCFEEIVGDVCDLLVPLASRKGLELIILFDQTLPLYLIGDPDRVKQILMNLIGNAIKFSNTGSVVVEFWHERNKREDIIRSKNEQSSNDVLQILSGKKVPKRVHEADLDDSKLGDEIILHCSVKDQGIGMTPEEQKMLFVSFQQTDNGTTRKYGGTGLGLSICAQLIAHMHGKILVQSEKGKGATFTFSAKLRTETDYDVEQNPTESARINECCRILQARLDAISGKRVLILSPNPQLRHQIVRILKDATCYEFDDIGSAVANGAVMITDECTLSRPEDMDVEGEGRDETKFQTENIRTIFECAMPGGDYMVPFDIIIVDHVLDSAELDRIYPAPVVAFVLLLAPTTETLRLILPPAINRAREPPPPPEEDSSPFDIGGRGRTRGTEQEYVPARIQRDLLESRTKQNKAAFINASGNVITNKPSVPSKAIKPSQLFKKRNSRGHITITKPVPQLPGMCHEKPRMETKTFQVCRLIKPMRRMKLLQVLYNAFSRHCQLQIETRNVGAGSSMPRGQDGRSSRYGYDEAAERRKRYSLTDGAMSPLSSPSSPTSPTWLYSNPTSPIAASSASSPSGPLKRRRDQVTIDAMLSELKRCPKSSRHNCGATAIVSHANSSLLDPFAEKDVPRNLGLSGAMIGERESNLRKRARNNDALTLLLTPEERKRCRGKNVLVAEDDFVSQKILEKQLSKLGMNVIIANNGQEAVNQWLTAERGHYSIAIFDHHMPIMDGLAATMKLRALESEEDQDLKDNETSVRIPIVGLSADIQLSTKESCIKAGMDEYMTKPLLTKGLALLIQRYCCN
ncbi:histidine kinase osmosensor [Modicella reniformis]|uniref:Histidine kinase osmosensor n=1 Tax=Modicella reniformis TaxID=1440133 RepID=A0A9P6LZZ1_9FUNG|nr:histidine kinase osmosensor [Modicella reniformis]